MTDTKDPWVMLKAERKEFLTIKQFGMPGDGEIRSAI